MGISHLPAPLNSVTISDGINSLIYLSGSMQPSEVGSINIFSTDTNYLPTSWVIFFGGQGYVPGMGSRSYIGAQEDYATNSGSFFYNHASNVNSPGEWTVSTVTDPVPERNYVS